MPAIGWFTSSRFVLTSIMNTRSCVDRKFLWRTTHVLPFFISLALGRRAAHVENFLVPKSQYFYGFKLHLSVTKYTGQKQIMNLLPLDNFLSSDVIPTRARKWKRRIVVYTLFGHSLRSAIHSEDVAAQVVRERRVSTSIHEVEMVFFFFRSS